MSNYCPHCGHEMPRKLTPEEYHARAIPRLAALDALSARIDFATFAWSNTPEGLRWLKLMEEQNKDEHDAGM